MNEKENKFQHIISSGIYTSLNDLIKQETLVQKEISRGFHGGNGAKGHKHISKHLLHPVYKSQNLKQQAGFNAEINFVTKSNVKSIRNGSSVFAFRTDEIGRINDQETDVVWINEKTQQQVFSSKTQIKFRGSSGKENIQLFLTPKEFQKYEDQLLAIPSEQFSEALIYLDKQIASLEQKREFLKDNGNVKELENLLQKKDRVESVKSRLIDGGSRKKAMQYRLNPLNEYLKDSIKEAHYAGKQAAIQGAVIANILTVPFIAKRLYSDENYKITDGSKDYFKQMVTSIVSSYVVTGATILIQGQLTQSPSDLTQNFLKMNMTRPMITTSVEITKNLKRLSSDPNYELSNFLTDTSEYIVASLSATFFTTAFKSVLPKALPKVIASFPGMLGYIAGQYIVKELIRLENEARISKERLHEIKEFCSEMKVHLDMLDHELEMIQMINIQNWRDINVLMNIIKNTKSIPEMNDAVVLLAKKFEIELRLTDFADFNEVMSDSDLPFKL